MSEPSLSTGKAEKVERPFGDRPRGRTIHFQKAHAAFDASGRNEDHPEAPAVRGRQPRQLLLERPALQGRGRFRSDAREKKIAGGRVNGGRVIDGQSDPDPVRGHRRLSRARSAVRHHGQDRSRALPVAALFERRRQGASDRGARRESLLRFKCRAVLARRPLGLSGRVERAAQMHQPVRLETDGRRRSQAEPAHGRREILPAQVIGGQEKRDARFPRPFRGAQADRFESLFRLRTLSRLEVLRRPRELGIEVRRRGAWLDVALEKRAGEKRDRGRKHETGKRVIG
jgi:hypothetical protein